MAFWETVASAILAGLVVGLVLLAFKKFIFTEVTKSNKLEGSVTIKDSDAEQLSIDIEQKTTLQEEKAGRIGNVDINGSNLKNTNINTKISK